MKTKTHQPDLFDARAARDEALARVEENGGPWKDRALAALKCLPDGFVGTGEEIRFRLSAMGIGQPHHHNAWGAFTNRVVRMGLLRKTGQWRQMRGPRSHARATPEYQVILEDAA